MGTCGEDKKRKEIPLNETEKAILECKTCRDKISKYIKRLSKKQTKSRDKAKELVRSKQKDRAKVYLRMAKLHGEQNLNIRRPIGEGSKSNYSN